MCTDNEPNRLVWAPWQGDISIDGLSLCDVCSAVYSDAEFPHLLKILSRHSSKDRWLRHIPNPLVKFSFYIEKEKLIAITYCKMLCRSSFI